MNRDLTIRGSYFQKWSFNWAVAFFLLLPFALPGNSIGENQNPFALTLYAQLPVEKEGNLLFSPYTIFSNLYLLSFGAAGQTQSQLQKGLFLPSANQKTEQAFTSQLSSLEKRGDIGYAFRSGVALFSKKEAPLLSPFEEVATTLFRAKLYPVPFDQPAIALPLINGWVKEQTQGKIGGLISPKDLGPNTRLIALSTLYFEGKWAAPFYMKQNRRLPFHPPKGDPFEVEMLCQTTPFPYFEDEEMQGLFLPFVANEPLQSPLSCLILLPKGELSLLEERLSPSLLSHLAQLSTSNVKLIDVTIPKFRLTKHIVLNQPLQALGIEDPFLPEANFSLINGKRDLFLSKVLHGTYFSLDEKGVTAASATSSHIEIRSTPPTEEVAIPFLANRPFLFFLIDQKSEAILFMGRVAHPQGGSLAQG